MASLHVGVITFDWYPYEPRALRLAEAAANAGYEVDVICLRQPHEKGYAVHNGVHIYRMPMSRSVGRSLPINILHWCWFLLLAGAAVAWLHLRRPYDVIHVHNMPDFLVFSALFPRLLGAKIILYVQDVSPELMSAKAKGHQRKVVIRLAIWQEQISTAFAHHVVTTGWLFEEVLLPHGDVGIIPYRCNGFAELVLPTKCYEFAWMQRPMIASDTRAIRSMFRSESIVLCDHSKPESFAEAIIELYQHPEKRAQLVANAAEDYQPYRWEFMAQRYQKLLVSLCRQQEHEREASHLVRKSL